MEELRRKINEHKEALLTLAEEKAKYSPELVQLKRTMDAATDIKAYEKEYDSLLRDSRVREYEQLREDDSVNIFESESDIQSCEKIFLPGFGWLKNCALEQFWGEEQNILRMIL